MWVIQHHLITTKIILTDLKLIELFAGEKAGNCFVVLLCIKPQHLLLLKLNALYENPY